MKTHCPNCGADQDQATPVYVPHAKPEAGDFSICIKCAAVSVFTGTGLERRTPTTSELAEFSADPQCVRAVLAARQVIHTEGIKV